MKISSEAQLRELYGFPKGRAVSKVLSALEDHAMNFISQSPFFILSTSSADGRMDASPRGGEPGFVHVLSDTQIAIPDHKGNNRLDSMVNIIETGRVGLIFLIPGIDETLRINGSAAISTDAVLLDRFNDERVKTVMVVEVEECFLHCAKAFMRSKLWQAESYIDNKNFPSMGQMLKDQIKSEEEAESREAMIERYQPDL